MARKKNTKTENDKPEKTVELADVIARNKRGESAREAVERVSKDHPGKEVQFEDPDTPPKARDETNEKKNEDKTIDKAKKEIANGGNPIKVEAATLDGGMSTENDMLVNAANVPEPSEVHESQPAVKIPGFAVQQGNFHERINWKSSFPTSWEVTRTAHEYIWTAKCTELIGAFETPLEFLRAVSDLADKLVTKYDGVRRKVDSIIEPSTQEGKITDPSLGGFNLTRFRDTNKKDQHKELTHTIQAMLVDSIDRKFETAYFVGSEWERQLLNQSKMLWERDMRPIRDVHQALKSVLDTTEYSVAPLDDKYLRVPESYLINWESPRYDILVDMLDKNRVLHQDWVTLSSVEIMRLLSVRATSEAIKTSELRKTLQISNTRQTGLTDITNVIDQEKAFQGLHLVIMSILFRRYFAINVEASLTAFSFTVLIEFILLKLLVPEKSLTRRSRNRINNYILEHLLMNLRSGYFDETTRARKYARPTMEEFDTRDFLFENRTSIPAGMAPFLLGWANDGDDTPYMFSNTPYTFSDGVISTVVPSEIVGRTYGFQPWGGRMRVDYTELTNQQHNFSSFIVALTKDRFLSGHALGNDAALVRMFTFFEQRRESIAMLMYYANELMTKMAISPLCMPTARDETIEDGMFTKNLDGGMVLSLLTILIPDTFHTKPPTMDLITAGRGIGLGLKRFIEQYYLHTDVMPKKSYFKHEIIEAAFTKMPDSPLKQSLKTIILGAPEKHHFIFPDRAVVGDPTVTSRPYSMTVMARQIVLDYPEDFGYAPYFYYIPFPFRQDGENVPVSPKLFEYYVQDNEPELYKTYTFPELLDDLLDSKYSSVVRGAYNSNKAIKFDFPIRMNMLESAPDDHRELPPFNYIHASAVAMSDKLRVGVIDVFYQWREEYTDVRTNSQAGVRPPVYQVPSGYLDFDVFEKFLRLPRELVTYRSGVEDLSMNEFISMIRRSDV